MEPLISHQKHQTIKNLLAHLPRNALYIVGALAAVNVTVWIVVAVVLAALNKTSLLSTAALAYSLGFRHALDADHISAIDVTTRRLVAAGQTPATVGTFFSLGHSTIVIVTCIVVAATSEAITHRFDKFSNVGGIIGTSVSASFLLLLGGFNVWILAGLISSLKAYARAADVTDNSTSPGEASGDVPGRPPAPGGPFTRIFKGLFRLIDRPWKIYPVGVLFGLGFDTSSEVALLAIASLQGSAGTSLWIILIFPLLFTAGMCLLDTLDGAMMLTLYTRFREGDQRSRLPYLYYSTILTAMTSLIALVIGVIQVLSVIQSSIDPQGKFWDGVSKASDSYDVIGGSICGGFLVITVISMCFYRRFEIYIEGLRQKALSNRDDAATTGIVCLSGCEDQIMEEPGRKDGDATPNNVNYDNGIEDDRKSDFPPGSRRESVI